MVDELGNRGLLLSSGDSVLNLCEQVRISLALNSGALLENNDNKPKAIPAAALGPAEAWTRTLTVVR